MLQKYFFFLLHNELSAAPKSATQLLGPITSLQLARQQVLLKCTYCISSTGRSGSTTGCAKVCCSRQKKKEVIPRFLPDDVIYVSRCHRPRSLRSNSRIATSDSLTLWLLWRQFVPLLEWYLCVGGIGHETHQLEAHSRHASSGPQCPRLAALQRRKPKLGPSFVGSRFPERIWAPPVSHIA